MELMEQSIPNSSHTRKQRLLYRIQTPKTTHFRQSMSTQISDTCRRVQLTCGQITRKQGIHSLIVMRTAGFRYTDKEDQVCCDNCKLEVSGWTLDMKPFDIHAQRSPTCAFVRSILPSQGSTVSSGVNLSSLSSEEEKPCKRQKTEATQANCESNILVEIEILKQVRKRTFSHWPHRASPSSGQMIEAGFFCCNVGDRVICLYCKIICQQWTPHIDDPCQIHKTLSPKCPFVIAMSKQTQASSIPIVNGPSTMDNSIVSTDNDRSPYSQIVTTTACNMSYREIPQRYASFTTWPTGDLPSVEDLVRAGFFFTGTNTIVTCFYCNGSLQNWGVNDNPTDEHARWFPHCAYVKQLCGDKQYQKIQESNRRLKERNQCIASNKHSRTNVDGLNSGRLSIPDENTLSRLVAARLDLPISQKLLDQDFRLSVIKRCWEDQLRLKHDDFVSDTDLVIACMILQKQIEYIDGKKENIIVPSAAMNKIREKTQTELLAHKQVTSESIVKNSSNNTDVDISASSQAVNTETPASASISITDEKQNMKSDGTDSSNHRKIEEISPLNPCVLCLTEERGLACIPCGHLATCVPCGHSLRTCPICRSGIDGFVRVYI